MSEQLDNELRKRISEVFENYEDTAPSNEGWAMLRQKFPENKPKRIIPLWWMATAAMLLILSMFAIWLYQQPGKTTENAGQSVVKTTINPQKPVAPNHDSQEAVSAEMAASNNLAATNDKQKQPSINEPSVTNHSIVGNNAFSADAVNTNVVTNTQALPVENNIAGSVISQSKLAANSGSVLMQNKGGASYGADSTQINSPAMIAQQKPVATDQHKSIIAVKKDSAAVEAGQSRMAAFLANEQKKEDALIKGKEPSEKANVDKKVMYGVYAATYFNYAEGSKSQVNAGAGFSTDIRLSKNFKLSTGVAIGRNTLSYENQPVSASLQSDAAYASDFAKVEVIPISNLNQLGFTPLRVAASPTISAYNISLTGLDVPVNIKYEFNPQRSDAYISAGLSSGTFISENFRYKFDSNIRDGIATSNTSSIPDATSSRSFTGFNFARTLNLSMGMGYQLSRHNRLVIEPFFKYPLGGLGSQQIRFGSGGVNLQFKFQGSKK
ncbi:outer membrane beta-barrel protein [Mucilaginibacter aquatilis]|uniref:Outer membrane beta-barrel protein n=1 Tax=Mucilaginibacter aquatilis TaxID=1517760 RepID=A0A6I4ICJ3_9SPHI|nr:outer membrane beta-barrel protein [Mucilaginibacter aquatilis]MVN92951.1 outer membrane beta-barrel protein [Mucilaginibacter aquatilis]